MKLVPNNYIFVIMFLPNNYVQATTRFSSFGINFAATIPGILNTPHTIQESFLVTQHLLYLLYFESLPSNILTSPTTVLPCILL
jgi:hypothetical protein